MKHMFTLLGCVAALGLISSCKKDDTKTKTDLLTAHPWKITAYTLETTTGTNPTTSRDIYAQSASCAKDNFQTFNKDGIWVQDEGLTKCSTTAPQQISSHWDLTSSETKLTLDTEVYDLVALSENTMMLRLTQTNGSTTSVSSITLGAF